MKAIFLQTRYTGKVDLGKIDLGKLPKKIGLVTTTQFLGKIDEIKTNPELEKQAYEEHARKILEEQYKDVWEGYEKEQKDIMIEEKVERFTVDIADKAIRQKAIGSITEREKREAYAKDGVYDGLAKIGGKYFSYESGNRKRKYATELEGWQKRTMDYARAIEGKSANNGEAWERSIANKDTGEILEGMGYEQLEDKVLQTGADIKKLRGKQKSGQELSPTEHKALDSKIQQQTRFLGAFIQEYPGSLAGVVGALDSSYGEVNLEERGNIGKVVAGLLTGREWSEVKEDAGFLDREKELRKHFKEKEGRLFRLLEISLDKASDKGATTFYRQISEGLDENGERVLGFSHNFTDGAGDGKKLGSGVIGKDGKTWQKSQEEIMKQSELDTNTVKDARLLFTRRTNSQLRGYQSDRAAETHFSYAYLPSNKIMDLSQSDANTIWGGSYGASSYNAEKGAFVFETEEIQKGVASLVSKAIERVRKAKERVERQRNLLALQTLLYKGQIKKVLDKEGKEVNVMEAEANDIIRFINTKLLRVGGGDSPVIKDAQAKVSDVVKKAYEEIGTEIEEISPLDVGGKEKKGGGSKEKKGGGSKESQSGAREIDLG